MAQKLSSSPSTTNLRPPQVSKIITSNVVVDSRKPFSPRRRVHDQLKHSLPPHKIEIFKSLESWAETNLLVHLKPVEKSWQPQDFLPNSASEEEFHQQILELKESCKEMPDELFVILAGEMITEEALPMYQSYVNNFNGVGDETGASPTSWAVWTRGWTAEENRHGDLLNKYLYLSGRVDMRQVEKTIQYLIGSGMDVKTDNNPYLGFIYTSFQERATFLSHGTTGRLAKEHNNPKLAQICGTIAADEKRHEVAYTKIVEKLFEIDPDGTVLALENMMRKNIFMPSQLMDDGKDENLFRNFSAVSQRMGVYTVTDYIDIIDFFIGRWNVEKLRGLTDKGRRAQEYLCGLPAKIKKVEERTQQKPKTAPKAPFSWLFGREMSL